MAGGAAGKQNVMKMTQIIWYRSQTAPIPKSRASAPAYQAAGSKSSPAPSSSPSRRCTCARHFGPRLPGRSRGSCTTAGNRSCRADVRPAIVSRNPETQHELARLTPRGRPTAGSDAAADSRGEERRGLSGELCLGDVRRSHHVQLFRLVPLLAGRRVSGPALCPPATGDRFRRDHYQPRPGRFPRAGDGRLRRDYAGDGRADQSLSGPRRDHRGRRQHLPRDQARHPAHALRANRPQRQGQGRLAGHRRRASPTARPAILASGRLVEPRGDPLPAPLSSDRLRFSGQRPARVRPVRGPARAGDGEWTALASGRGDRSAQRFRL